MKEKDKKYKTKKEESANSILEIASNKFAQILVSQIEFQKNKDKDYAKRRKF